MTQVLPTGLVSNTDHISTELRDTGHVDVEDIAKLWKGKTRPTYALCLVSTMIPSLSNMYFSIYHQ